MTANYCFFWDGDGSGRSSDGDSDRNELASGRNRDFLGDELCQSNTEQFWGNHQNESAFKLRLRETARIEEMVHRQKRGGVNVEDVHWGNDGKHFDDEERGSGRFDAVDSDWFGGRHFIVSGSEDGALCIWDRITLKMVRLEGHHKAANCAAWNPRDSFLLVSGSHDCSIRIWAPSSTRNRFRVHSHSDR